MIWFVVIMAGLGAAAHLISQSGKRSQPEFVPVKPMGPLAIGEVEDLALKLAVEHQPRGTMIPTPASINLFRHVRLADDRLRIQRRAMELGADHTGTALALTESMR